MIERDRVWWCWWTDARPWMQPVSYIACGYSRYAMDVREGVYDRGRVRYAANAFDADNDPEGAPTHFLASHPNGSADDVNPWGTGIEPVKVDIDVAVRMGLRPPEWRGDLPMDRAPTVADISDARDGLTSDVVSGGVG